MPTPDDSLSLLDKESYSSPPRRPQRSKLTPCRFCLGLVVLFVGAVISVICWQLGQLAWTSLGEARFPHRAHHHNESAGALADVGESAVVRSFYGDGGVDKFDLIATIYYRQFVRNETTDAEVVSGEEAGQEVSVISTGQQLIPGPWERVYSNKVSEGLTLKSKRVKMVQPVTLPGRVVSSLRNSTQRSSLVASFHLRPSTVNTPGHLVPISSSHYTSLIDPITNVSTRTFPSPWPALGDTLEEQRAMNQSGVRSWRDELVKYMSIQELLREVIVVDPAEVEAKEDGEGEGELEKEKTEEGYSIVVDGKKVVVDDKEENLSKKRNHAIVTRSMVTMVRDSSVYSLESFKKQMATLGESQSICNDLAAGRRITLKSEKGRPRPTMPDCRALLKFDGHGHFQSLFEMGTEEEAAALLEEQRKTNQEGQEIDVKLRDAEVEERKKGEKGWRYGAFIQATAGFPGPADLIELSSNASSIVDVTEEPDLTFDWHLSFTTSSPLKAALTPVLTFGNVGGVITSNRSAHEVASGQDSAELFNALLGHPFDPSTRPIVRGGLRALSSTLSFFSFVIQAYFWITRSVSTGISVPGHAVNELVSYVSFIWQGVFDYKEMGPTMFWFTFVAVTTFSAIVVSVLLNLEVTWWGYIPRAVRKRKPSHLERASARVDMKFDWTQRGAISLLIFLFALLVPKLPYVIHASPPQPTTPEAGSSAYFISKAPYMLYLAHLEKTSSILLFISQFLLNRRSKTFGQTYRVLAVVDFVSHVFHALPVVLSGWWGRWGLMDPLDVWDVLDVGMHGASAWQAWNYKGVKQEEEEEE